MPDSRSTQAVRATVLPWRAWLTLSRIPFMSVALLPFVLGMVIAVRAGHSPSWDVTAAAVTAVLGILLCTHWLGEYFDLAGDRINTGYNRFSGGSRVLVNGLVRPRLVLAGSVAVLLLTVVLGIYIAAHPSAGPLVLPLGIMGIIAGAGYSARPFCWAYRGAGEILIGLAYGLLTVNTGYYLVAGSFSLHALIVSVPLALSVFNVIVINEFPDYRADRAAGKKNLVVRYGLHFMARVYMAAALGAAAWLMVSVHLLPQGPAVLPLLLPATAIAVWNASSAARGDYVRPGSLEALCGRSIILNLVTALGYTIAFVVM